MLENLWKACVKMSRMILEAFMQICCLGDGTKSNHYYEFIDWGTVFLLTTSSWHLEKIVEGTYSAL